MPNGSLPYAPRPNFSSTNTASHSMFIFKRVHHLRNYLHAKSGPGHQVGFVPTMGALHEGHLSLVEQSRDQCKTTVVSIFVNPLQFNDPDDLKRYPRPVEDDIRMLEKIGTEVLFLPEVTDIYPPGDDSRIDFDPGPASTFMEGKFRPGHFQGMAEVVYRLLKIVEPACLFMGQKDYQQLAIIRKLIRDFQLPIQLVMCPTVRESNGLARSSRNMLLSEKARDSAGHIFQALKEGRSAYEAGQPINHIQRQAMRTLHAGGLEPEYFEIVDGITLQPVTGPSDAEQIVACCAARIEGVRLIDNMIWKP